MQRAIDSWIEGKKHTLSKKSGPAWGVLIHGNRILSAAVFKKYDSTLLSQSIAAFSVSIGATPLDKLCEGVYDKMVDAVQLHYPSKFLAVLFKNPTMSKRVFDLALV
jgi:hypothetical protein